MAKKIDLLLILLVFILSVLGLINFFSASYYYSLKNFQNPYFYFQRFLIRITLLGVILFFIGHLLGKKLTQHKKLFLLSFFLFYFSIFLGFLPKFRLQETAARWVNLGFLSFQPAEILKPFAILFFIFLMAGIKKFSLWQKIFIFLFFAGLVLLPIFVQPSYSNVLILGSSIATVFLKSLKSKKEIFSALFSLLIVFLILSLFGTYFWKYRLERITSFLTKGQVFKEKYFQVEQSILAISSGGILGKGLGKSEIKILGLPQMLTDSIFAIYAEEFGFVGSLILLILFFLLISRIIILGAQTNVFEKEAFSFAVSVWLFLQTFLHLASNIGLFFPTGVILPFFSYGASGELAIYFSLGIINSFKNG